MLLIDPGITGDEMADLANDLHKLGQPVVVGFSTHPHWDHLLWHAKFGEVPRYGTARCAADIRDLLSQADWKTQVTEVLPPDIGDQIPLDDPQVRIIEHQAHAPGHAALLIEGRGVLVAGDLLSDTLIPFLELDAADPIEDYLAALRLLEGVADDVKVFIPGHGSVGDADQLRARIEQDRAYVQALRDGGGSDDLRLSAPLNKDWLPGVHGWQLRQLAQRSERDGMPG